MSKKRKRHEHDPQSVPTVVSAPTSSALEAKEVSQADFAKVLSPREIDNIRKKLFYTDTLVTRAFKKACGFEAQKIIKRIKTARYTSYFPHLQVLTLYPGRKGVPAKSNVSRKNYI